MVQAIGGAIEGRLHLISRERDGVPSLRGRSAVAIRNKGGTAETRPFQGEFFC